MNDKAKNNDWCDGVLACRETVLTWMTFARESGDEARERDLKRLAETFQSMVDNEVTAVQNVPAAVL